MLNTVSYQGNAQVKLQGRRRGGICIIIFIPPKFQDEKHLYNEIFSDNAPIQATL
jgi:hypothetical protein